MTDRYKSIARVCPCGLRVTTTASHYLNGPRSHRHPYRRQLSGVAYGASLGGIAWLLLKKQRGIPAIDFVRASFRLEELKEPHCVFSFLLAF